MSNENIFKYLEYLGVLNWIIYLILAVKQNILCWLFGIIASIITILIFYHAKIYLEATLNIYYVLAAIYGWWKWSKKEIGVSNMVQQWSFKEHCVAVVVGLLIWQCLAQLMLFYVKSPNPYIDAFTATFSCVATFMEAKKVLTCWIFWIVVNFILVFLQIERGIYLYAGLSSFFVLMSCRGFYNWRKTLLVQ